MVPRPVSFTNGAERVASASLVCLFDIASFEIMCLCDELVLNGLVLQACWGRSKRHLKGHRAMPSSREPDLPGDDESPAEQRRRRLLDRLPVVGALLQFTMQVIELLTGDPLYRWLGRLLKWLRDLFGDDE